ncbi:MAG: hypothetical protein GF353_08900 [Candidatus Lokiarchaeota archaeon]|nr:hypothetical protein [Candidatus Lokiarchaeota archaeon]
MEIFPPLNKFTPKQWAIMLSNITIIGLIFSLHFFLEFTIIRKAGLSDFYILFHLLGLPLGAIFAIKIFYRMRHLLVYTISMSSMIFFFIALYLINQKWFVPVGLLGAGISIGVILGVVFEQLAFITKDTRFAGRLFSFGIVGTSLIVIILAFLDLLGNVWMMVGFLILIFTFTLGFTLYGRTEHKIIAQKSVNIISFLKNSKNLALIAFSFFLGFFFTNTYYATLLILEQNNLKTDLNLIVILLFFCVAIISFFCGFIADTLGRRLTVLLGLIIEALAFLLFSLFDNIIDSFIYIFIIIVGIGFTMSFSMGLLLGLETVPRRYVRDHAALFMMFAGLGESSGVILAEILKPIILDDPAYLTMILIFIFFTASFIIFQLRETLPSRAEIYKRPDNLSAEEIELCKENKICIVCKNKVSRVLYLCPQCESLYCTKCAEALSNLDNCCWVCEIPFDDSKPSKSQDPYSVEDIGKKSKIS